MIVDSPSQIISLTAEAFIVNAPPVTVIKMLSVFWHPETLSVTFRVNKLDVNKFTVVGFWIAAFIKESAGSHE